MREKIICVEWDDASWNSGYYDKYRPENFEPVKTKTVGHFVKRTAKAIIVSQDRFYTPGGKVDDDRHTTTIPLKMITRVTQLREFYHATNEKGK